MQSGSKINPRLTLEYMQTEEENKYFDRKSAQIRVADLAPHISAFANADGGTLVIGISDKKRALEGINSIGNDRINELINAPKEGCRPMPSYREEFVDITNAEGKPDRLLLLHIEPSIDQIIRTSNDRTYLRIGDKSKEMLGENLRNLEYAKGSRHFEEEINEYATIEDLDETLLDAYKKRIGAEGMDTHQVLSARGFIRKRGGEEYLTNAAVLLFAENMLKFNMNCRIRFIRVDGRKLQVGDKYNVVKDKSIDEPILRLVNSAKAFISDQLRVFTRQEHGSGRFVENPEYPEFPWFEGIVNAVAHRDYAASGQFILVSMYDDRLEIDSPGRLPDIVTLDNMSYTRFSRNKMISRVMTEFEWVRELNEGVGKIFADMEAAGLPAPEYVETPNTVKLILRNNIDERTAYRKEVNAPLDNNEGADTDGKTDGESSVKFGESSVKFGDIIPGGTQNEIIRMIMENNRISAKKIADEISLSVRAVEKNIKELREKGILVRHGSARGGYWEVTEKHSGE